MPIPRPLILTNDDGYDAPGITALRDALGGGATIVAPREPHSGCSHIVTVDRPVAVERVSDALYIVDGSPADCVRMALKALAMRPAMILSGINAGGNLGHDIYLSGTVAAAREAALHRVPAVALSQYLKRGAAPDWPRSAALAVRALEAVLVEPLEIGEYWNINLPHCAPDAPEPDLVRCAHCTRALPVQYRENAGFYHYEHGLYHTRETDPDSDVEVCFGGDVALCRLRV